MRNLQVRGHKVTKMRQEERKSLLEAFSKRLRHLLVQKGFGSTRSVTGVNISELARVTGCSKTMCQRYCANEALPDPEIIARIAKWLNVSSGWLLFGDSPTHFTDTKTIGIISIDRELLQYILSRVMNLCRKENIDETVDFAIETVEEICRLSADRETIFRVVDMIVSSAERFNTSHKEAVKE